MTRRYGVPQGLLIRYTVTNSSGQTVYVMDRSRRMGQNSASLEDEPDPLLTWVLAGKGAELLLVKELRPAGPNLDYSTSTQGSVLPPGATHQGRAFLPYPLTDFNAENPLPESPTSYRFCVGIVPAAAGTPTNADQTVALVPDSRRSEQSRLCTPSHPLPAS